VCAPRPEHRPLLLSLNLVIACLSLSPGGAPLPHHPTILIFCRSVLSFTFQSDHRPLQVVRRYLTILATSAMTQAKDTGAAGELRTALLQLNAACCLADTVACGKCASLALVVVEMHVTCRASAHPKPSAPCCLLNRSRPFLPWVRSEERRVGKGR